MLSLACHLLALLGTMVSASVNRLPWKDLCATGHRHAQFTSGLLITLVPKGATFSFRCCAWTAECTTRVHRFGYYNVLCVLFWLVNRWREQGDFAALVPAGVPGNLCGSDDDGFQVC